MKNTFLALFLALMCSGLLLGQESLTVHFDSADSTLSPESTRLLSKMLDTVSDADSFHLRGYADNTGRATYNDSLAAARCREVVRYLTSKSVAAPRITWQSFGEDDPVASNATGTGRAQNRRVVISWSGSKPLNTEVPGNINTFFATVQPAMQQFCIRPERDTILTCRGGTIVAINEAAFSTHDNGTCINIQIQEVLDAKTALLLRLTTVSDDRILQTGGMFYMQATDADGRILTNKEGEITVFIPRETAGMGLFTGTRDADSNMNWTPTDAGSLGTLSPDDFSNCMNCLTNQKNCRFFWCRLGRIDDAVAGLFSSKKRAKNRQWRAGIRDSSTTLGSTGPNVRVRGMISQMEYLPCGYLAEMIRRLNVDNTDGLLTELGLPRDSTFTQEQWLNIAQESQKKYQKMVEERIAAGSANLEDMDYYFFNAQQSTWYNIDQFLKLDKELLANISILMKPNSETTCKLVFPDERVLLTGRKYASAYTFSNVPVGSRPMLVTMRYSNEKAFVEIKEIVIEKYGKYEVVLKEQTTEAFLAELEKITW
jgi:hypothetical protein